MFFCFNFGVQQGISIYGSFSERFVEMIGAGYTDEDLDELIKAAFAKGWAKYEFLQNQAKLP